MKHIFAAHFRNYFVGGILFAFVSGCSVIDPAEEIPSYLHIDSMSLSTTGNQGSSSAEITDAWIFMDGELVGAFQLPCTVPILAEGNHNFIIRGGVKENGLSSTRAIYPSWKGWEGPLTLTRGQKVTVNPVITYFPAQDFQNTWMEDFDQAGTGFSAESGSGGIVRKVSAPYAFEGTYSGYIHLDNADTLSFIGSSAQAYTMPPSKETWLEFNYWCDGSFTVGIEQNGNPNNRVGWVGVAPNRKWGKMYIRLTDALASATQNVDYKIYFAMQNFTGQSDVNLYIDNIKLLK